MVKRQAVRAGNLLSCNMKCPKCGKEIANDSNFCEYCGSSVSNNHRKKTIWITLGLIVVSFIGFAFLWMGRQFGGQTYVIKTQEAGDSTVAENDEFVDLGLPSGTLWKKANENGLYTYDEAIERFGNKLPTKAQLEELQTECQWTWTELGYKVTGPNDNSIVLPAEGFRGRDGELYSVGSSGYYWSSMPDGLEEAWYLYSFSTSVGMKSCDRCSCFSVRLVQDK